MRPLSHDQETSHLFLSFIRQFDILHSGICSVDLLLELRGFLRSLLHENGHLAENVCIVEGQDHQKQVDDDDLSVTPRPHLVATQC
jgi:hypothetical protein